LKHFLIFDAMILGMTDEQKPSKNPFDFLDFTLEEGQEANEQLAKSRIGRDKRVCVCGHPMSRHSLNPRGAVVCKPTAMYCPCKEKRAVLEVEDCRDFLFKTAGSAKFHALGRGITASVEKGHEITWIIDIRCDRCGEEKPIVPVAVSQNGMTRDEATGYDALLCRECRQQV
jgi:hypothetical protein